MQKAEAPRLKKIYEDKVAPELNKKFGCKNIFQIPKVTKVVVNMGISEGPRDFAAIEEAVEELGINRRTETGNNKSQKKHCRL